jgi:hypothetical protein
MGYWENLQERAAINLICALDAEIVAKQQCIKLSCDKDFPDFFRPKIWETIQTYSLELPEGRIEENVVLYKETKKSRLIQNLKNLWSQLADSGVVTRFGVLLDDPAASLAAKEAWDRENEDFELKKQGEKKS